MLLKELIKENAKVRAALVGKTKKGKNIQSFGIISPENPMGKKLTYKENLKIIEDMKKQLKAERHPYTRVQGKYINKEKSFFIYNIGLGALKNLGNTYGQESFIFGNLENGEMVFHYYEKKAGSNQYSKVDSKKNILNQKDAKDLFSMNKSYKFQIPFNLGEAFKNAERELNEKYDYIDDETYNEAMKYNIEKSGVMTEKHLWIKRCKLYGSNK